VIFRINGVESANRTRDTGRFKPVLYRLSYLDMMKLADSPGVEPGNRLVAGAAH
jgi:hypothetical protein